MYCLETSESGEEASRCIGTFCRIVRSSLPNPNVHGEILVLVDGDDSEEIRQCTLGTSDQVWVNQLLSPLRFIVGQL